MNIECFKKIWQQNGNRFQILNECLQKFKLGFLAKMGLILGIFGIGLLLLSLRQNSHSTVLMLLSMLLTPWGGYIQVRQDRKKDIKLNYLMSAFRKLAMASNRDPQLYSLNEYNQTRREAEVAGADIQLLGTKRENELLEKFLKEFNEKKQGDLDGILTQLRDELRQELGLEKLHIGVKPFRLGPILSVDEANERDGALAKDKLKQ